MNLITMKWKFDYVIKKCIFRVCYGKNVKIDETVFFRSGFSIICSQNASVSIGKKTFFNLRCTITAQECVEIGESCIIGENVKIYDHNHRFNENKKIVDQGFKTGKVKINDDVWIGSNVIVLKGVEIGSHSVIAAGCIVDHSIPSDSILFRDGKVEKIVYKSEE